MQHRKRLDLMQNEIRFPRKVRSKSGAHQFSVMVETDELQMKVVTFGGA